MKIKLFTFCFFLVHNVYSQNETANAYYDSLVNEIHNKSILFHLFDSEAEIKKGSTKPKWQTINYFFVDPRSNKLNKLYFTTIFNHKKIADSVFLEKHSTVYFYHKKKLIKVIDSTLYRDSMQNIIHVFYYTKADYRKELGVCLPEMPNSKHFLMLGKWFYDKYEHPKKDFGK
jgi:hypothetical protein